MLPIRQMVRLGVISSINRSLSFNSKPQSSAIARTCFTWSVLNCMHKKSPCMTQRQKYSTAPQDVMSFENKLLRRYLKHLEEKFEDAERRIMLQEDNLPKDEVREIHNIITTLGPVVYKFRNYYSKEKELKEFMDMIQDLENSGDTETATIARLEMEECRENARELEQTLLEKLLPQEKVDDFDIILEVSAGVGGQEAMLFTCDIFSMYERFAMYCQWDFEVINTDENEIGGLRKASALISGEHVYKLLKYEGGVHRVQRVPKTEKSGRIHTSTMTVAIMPRPSEVDVHIKPSDLRVDTFRASGAGGQHVNTTNSAVRVTHAPTGTVVECQAGRSQIKNKEMALQILRSRIYEKELEAQTQKQQSQRKLQVGSRSRSDKIRTYNFQQDRVTDHRIHRNCNNIDGFLEGGPSLEELIWELQEEDKRERLAELLEDFAESQEKKKEKKGAEKA